MRYREQLKDGDGPRGMPSADTPLPPASDREAESLVVDGVPVRRVPVLLAT